MVPTPILQQHTLDTREHNDVDATDKSLKKNERVVPESEVKEMQKRIKELERLAGKQAMKIDILEEAVKIAREKKWISHDGSSNKGSGK